MFTFTKGVGGKINYNIFIALSTGESAGTKWTSSAGTFVKVGVCAEKPEINVNAGDSIKLNTGDEPVISKNGEFKCDILAVSKDNYEALAECINKKVDIVFSTADTHNGTLTTGECKLIGVTLFAGLNILGNDVSKIPLSGKREVTATDSTMATIG